MAEKTLDSSAAGSSPLARGAFGQVVDEVGELRIIPARAGCIRVMLLRRSSTMDHPRSRGVHPAGFTAEVLADGSSPLARGASQPAHPGP